MRKPIKALVLASAIAGAVAVTSPLYAEEPSGGASKGTDMIGGGNMMGGGNMATMMNMMTQMNQMMETCNKMMQGSMNKDHGSNPATPEKKG